jgi:GPI mannosyltransferase 3
MRLPGTFYDKISWIALLTFVLAAYFSVGYHHPDEHFQILEFASYKLGNIPAEDLPWEFEAQIRPGLQVFLAFSVFKALSFIGITDPFLLVFVLRLITAVLAWLVIRRLGLKLLDQFATEKGRKLFFAMIFFLWFVPYTSARFSSENLSGLTFLASLYLLLVVKDGKVRLPLAALLLSGLLLGFTFYLRFQMGFAMLGLALWLILIQKIKIGHLFFLATGCLAGLLVGHWADYWLYEEWVITPVNYFTANVVEDVASNWGVSPWWNYFYLFCVQVIPPLSMVLLLFFFYGISKNLRSVFLWILIPFLIAHFMVPHKETRFMFPMIFPFIFLVASGMDYFISRGKWLYAGKLVFILLLIMNVPLLLYRSFSPAREQVAYYEFLYDFAAEKPIEVVCFEHDIYRQVDLQISFYRSPHITCKVIPDESFFESYLIAEKPARVYLVERRLDSGFRYNGYEVQLLYSILPDWVTQININNWTSRARIWKIKELKRMQ